MTTFALKNIKNSYDLDALRKGYCPWCMEKLAPVFEINEDQEYQHVADECVICEDKFV